MIKSAGGFTRALHARDADDVMRHARACRGRPLPATDRQSRHAWLLTSQNDTSHATCHY